MAQVTPQQFCFLEVKGPAGRTDPSSKRLKNRNAQPRLRSKAASGNTRARGQEALPVQIRFKLISDTTAPPPANAPRPARCTTCGEVVSVTADVNAAASVYGEMCSRSHCGACESLASACRTSALTAYHDACLLFTSSLYAGQPLGRRDAKAINYFRTHGAIDLSGFLPGHFWDRLVLQASHSETLVRQAVIALGNAHLDHCTSAVVSPSTLADHATALCTLRNYMARTKNPSHQLVLLCSILLFAFSRVLGDIEAATIHLKTGLAILHDARKRLRTTSPAAIQGNKDVIHDLTVMFVQLDIESTMQDIDRGPHLKIAHDPVGAQYIRPDWIPSADMTSPHASMESWMYICHEMWRFISCNAQCRHIPMTQVPTEVIEHWQNIKTSIKIWRTATKDYLSHHPAIHRGSRVTPMRVKLDPEQILDAIRALIIESHYFSCKRFIAESLQDPHNPKPFDRHPEALLKTAETVVALRRTYYGLKDIHTKKTFTTHVGIVEALLLLVHRTTSPHIRIRAQELIGQFEEVQQGQTGLAAFFEGYTKDFMLIYEMPGH